MSEPESQIDDCNIICPYCRHEYQPESSDYSEDVRDEECEECGKIFSVWQGFSVTHHTAPKKEAK